MSKFKVSIIMFLLVYTNAFGAITKWTDSNGQIHYSDQPPPANAQSLTLPLSEGKDDSSSASGVPASKSITEREAELKKALISKKEAEEKAAQKQAALAAQQSNCNDAKQNLNVLQSGIRLMNVTPNGERSYIDDNERAQKIEKAQNDVNTFCK